MKKVYALGWRVALSLVLTCCGSAAELKVIVNTSVDASEISTDDLRAIFLGTKSGLKQGTHLQPVLVKAGPSLIILARHLGKTETGLETYYRSLVFSGRRSMPPFLSSDAEVAAYVAKTPDTIACVDASVPAPGARTLRLR